MTWEPKETPLSRGWVKLKTFWKRDDGTATVESVLWMPLFVGILALVADASLLFNSQAQMLRMVQDANRAFSTGQFDTTEEVEDWLLAQALPVSADSVAVSVLDTSTVPSGVIRTTLTMPARDLDAIGWIFAIVDFDMSVGAQHYVEN